MQISTSSAKIDFNFNEARPNATFSEGAIYFHLTKGFSTSPGSMADAFEFSGTVDAQTTAAELRTWRFAFIQTMEVSEFEAIYVGKDKSDGQITIRTSTGQLLDSGTAMSPWTSLNPARLLSSGKVQASFGDHPAAKAKGDMLCLPTNTRLFLRQFADRRSAVTVFVAEDPGGGRQFLASKLWLLNYVFHFKWKSDLPIVEHNESQLMHGSSSTGLNASPEVASLVRNPRPPFFNQHSRLKIARAVVGPPPERTDVDFRTLGRVPADFYT